MASQVGLGDAEAYYWTWSRQLAPGYYDHGPVVALLIRAGTALLGQTTLGVRLPFILLSALTLWLMGQLAARQGRGKELWAVLCLMAMPMFLVAGGAANPDVPFVALVVLLMATLMGPRPHSGPRLAMAGLLVGLTFCTKFFGLVLLLPLLHAAWNTPRRWPLLALSLGGALAGASPVMVWNATHGWASVAYHLGARHTRTAGPSLENLAKLLGGQLGYVSPMVLAGLVAAALVLWRRRRDPPWQPLLWIAAPLLLVGYLLILWVPGAEPHWPVAGYLPLVLVLAGRLPDWLSRRKLARVLTWLALGFAALVALAFHLHLLTDLGIRMMPASYQPRYDLSNELRGWPRVADEVRRQMQHSPALVAGCHYTTCAQLRFAARRRFEVICPSPRVDQFDFFAGGDGSTRHGAYVIYVRDERFPWDADQLYRCDRVQRLSTVEIRRARRTVRRFQLQLCGGYRGLRIKRWPPPPATAPTTEPP